MPTMRLDKTLILRPYGIDVTELKITEYAFVINPYGPVPPPPHPSRRWLLQPRPIYSDTKHTQWVDSESWNDSYFWTEIE